MTVPSRADVGSVNIRMRTRMTRRAFLRAAGLSGMALTLGLHQPTLGARRPVKVGSRALHRANGDRIAEVAAALDNDPETIFRFVSQQVRYDPYSGVLRGPLGTLAGRAGNSADQALLLAALLDAAGVPTRLAWGEIDDGVAESLAAAAIGDVATLRQEALDASLGVLPGRDATGLAIDPAMEAAIAQAAARADEVVSWARAQLTDTLTAFQQAFADATIQSPGGFRGIPDRERLQHIWVQTSSDGGWLDLDPTLPTSVMGAPLAGLVTAGEELPDDLYHRVDLSVIGESFSGGSLLNTPLLRVTARSYELAGAPIVFLNVPPEAGAGLSGLISPLSGMTTYVPALLVSGEGYVGQPIHFSRPADDGFFGEDWFGSTEPVDGDATAEYLELTLVAPDRDPQTVRRAIFDRFGPAARAAGADAADLGPIAIVDIGSDRDGEILPAQTMSWLTVSTGLVSPDDEVLADWDPELGSGAVIAHSHHFAREFAGLELALPRGVRAFADAPNVTAYTTSVRGHLDGSQLVDSSIDILHRSLGVVPVEGVAGPPVPAAVPGVVAHIAERLLNGDALPDARGADPAPASVGAVFDAARAEGIVLRALTSPGDTSDLAYPSDALARLEGRLSEGWLAVAPERSVTLAGDERAGWWLIDRATGRVIDELDDGRGAANIETVETLMLVTRASAEAWARARAITCAAGGAGVLGGLLIGIVGGSLAVYTREHGNDTASAMGALGAIGGGGVVLSGRTP